MKKRIAVILISLLVGGLGVMDLILGLQALKISFPGSEWAPYPLLPSGAILVSVAWRTIKKQMP